MEAARMVQTSLATAQCGFSVPARIPQVDRFAVRYRPRTGKPALRHCLEIMCSAGCSKTR